MKLQARKGLLAGLVAVFLAQTWMVYSDSTGRVKPLSAQAQAGWELWHSRGCQSCHQVYGFGGFLGPDLTNLASRIQAPDAAALAERLETALTTGSERMPAYRLDPGQREALAAFFIELDATGVGQAKVALARTPRELFAELAEQIPLGEGEALALAREGRRLALERGCIDCHLPNAKSAFRATDLTTLHGGVARERLSEVLSAGIPAKGMPALQLSPQEIEALAAFLEALARSASTVRDGFARAEQGSGGSLLDLPWFEYE